jgi:hypothetical protein
MVQSLGVHLWAQRCSNVALVQTHATGNGSGNCNASLEQMFDGDRKLLSFVTLDKVLGRMPHPGLTEKVLKSCNAYLDIL